MRKKRFPPGLAVARGAVMLGGGFSLIACGFWNLFGPGVGLITAGVLTVVLQWWVDSD